MNETPMSSDELATIKNIGFDYPFIPRRTDLPQPQLQETSTISWSFIKSNIGKELFHMSLPLYFNEPITTLQKCFEQFEYSWLLDQAAEWGKRGNNVMRAILVSTFTVTGYSSSAGRSGKPLNGLLGETYEANWEDKGLKFIAEQVSPYTYAFHCQGRGWIMHGDCVLKAKFSISSIQMNPVGTLTLTFDDGEAFQWEKITTSITNLLIKPILHHHGTMKIKGNKNINCEITFKEQSFMHKNSHQINGIVQDADGKTMAVLFGEWDKYIFYTFKNSLKEQKKRKEKGKGGCTREEGGIGGGEEGEDEELVWEISPSPPQPNKFNLSSFAITLNELTPDLVNILPPTDSRLRPDQRALENGLYDVANEEKGRLEQKQRKFLKHGNGDGWKPCWFEPAYGHNGTYMYTGGYWESRRVKNWSKCVRIFGPN